MKRPASLVSPICLLAVLIVVSSAPALAARSALDRELDGQIARLVESPTAPDALLRLYAVNGLAWGTARDGRVRATYTWVLQQSDASPVLKAHALWFLAECDRRDGNLLGAAEKHRRLGLITDWLVIGPFDNEGKSGFDAVYPPETEIDLDASYDGKERPVRWRRYPDGLGSAYVELGAIFRPRVQVAAYALTLVYSPVEQEAALRVGTDNAGKIWLDDALAFADEGYHPAMFDQAAAGLVLRKGWNKLLVKDTQGEGGWLFCLRITAPDGSPLPGLRVEADPEQVAALLPTITPRESLGSTELAEARPVEVDDPVAVFKRRAEQEPENAKVHADLAALYRYKRAFDDSEELDIKAYERAIELDPDNWRYYERVGPLYRDRNKQRDAFEKVIELNARRASAHVWLGHYHLRHGFYRKALAAFRAAVKADRTDYRGPLGLAAYDARFHHEVGAERTIADLCKRYPNTPALVSEVYRFSAFPRSNEEVVSVSRALLDFNAANDGAHRRLLGLAEREGDLDGMLRELHALQRFQPAETGLLLEEAKLLSDTGRFDEARGVLDRAIAVCPEDAEALEQLGRTAHWAGNDEQADEAWEDSLACRPQNAPLKEYIEYLSPEAAAFEDEYAVDVEALLDQQPSAEDYPDDGAVVMLDLQVYEVHPTGLSHVFGQRVVKILTKKGVEEFRTQYVPYTPETQEVKIQAARIYKPTGEVIDAQGPYDYPISNPSGSMYYSYNAMVNQYPKLEPGDVLEYRYRRNTIGETNIYADYFGSVAYFGEGNPVQHFKVVYITLAERDFYYTTVRSDVEPVIVEQDGKRIYTWETTDVPKVKSEPYMPGISEVTPYVHISTFRDWQALGDWYWGLVQDQFVLDKNVKEKVAELVEGKETVAEKVLAIHNWVLKNTRYIALEFGIHGHKPYKASKVFARGYGDCKDKASLMVAMLAEAGVEADLVLIRTTHKGAIEPFPVSLAVFNHAIAYVPELDLYLDGTAEFSGSRELPSFDQGTSVMRVSADRRDFTTTPRFEPEANCLNDSYTVTLGEDADVALEGARDAKGEYCGYYRYLFQEEAKRRETLEKQWRQSVPNTSIESVEFSDLKDLEQPVSYSYEGEVPDFLTTEPDGKLSFKLLLAAHELTKSYAVLAEREHDVVFRFPWANHKTVRYVLPEGAEVVELPAPFELETEHLDCSIATTAEEGAVVVTCTVVMKSVRIPVDEYAAFREACRTIDDKQSERIRISR
jgi:tetratricopeptide (TPR) repeat protein